MFPISNTRTTQIDYDVVVTHKIGNGGLPCDEVAVMRANERSVRSVYRTAVERFPQSEGFTVRVVRWRLAGDYATDIEAEVTP